MLKLTASYSKKIPADQEYSSQSYHCSVEVELPESLGPDGLRSRIHDTFALVRGSVETELNGNPGEGAEPAGRAAGNGQKATNKQVKFILDLAKGRGLGLSALNSRVHRDYGAETVYDLDRKAASRLVDELKVA